LGEFAGRVRTHAGPVTVEDFKGWINEIKEATGVKGKELFHPIRIALTGSHSGPEFDKVIPLIEDGAMMGLPIPTIHDRIEQFVGV
jgi:glutamyl/glutaminyl-tRNA synthetase